MNTNYYADENELMVNDDLRPREKLEKRGLDSLFNRELLALLIGWGGPKQDVYSIADEVSRLLSKDWYDLTIDKLLQIRGMGKVKSYQIIAALELARRFYEKKGEQILKSENVVALLHDIRYAKQEHFVSFTLSGANELIRRRIVSIGILDRSLVHPREIFADVLIDRAASVIFAHNHPSGKVEPSRNDIETQQRLEEAAHFLGIRVLDHIIVSSKGHYSFAENNLINNSKYNHSL